jgi:hypothetical protein
MATTEQKSSEGGDKPEEAQPTQATNPANPVNNPALDQQKQLSDPATTEILQFTVNTSADLIDPSTAQCLRETI